VGLERDEFGTQMRRAINLAGVFDRRDPRPGWQVRPQHLRAIAAAGFDGVRLPVRWWGHGAATPPYAIEERFLADVVELVDSALAFGLAVVLTMHHADGVHDDPTGSTPRLATMWHQITERFRYSRGPLAFELLNEPRAPMTAAQWHALLAVTLLAVRELDPDRVVVVGGADASTVGGLLQLDLPADANLVATVHYHEPFRFTHQGARWEADSAAWLGTGWGSPSDHAAVTADLETAAAWAQRREVPLLIGEFGVLSTADPLSRARWTAWVRREAERLGLPWTYWDFGTDFGAYDLDRGAWCEDLLTSLIG